MNKKKRNKAGIITGRVLLFPSSHRPKNAVGNKEEIFVAWESLGQQLLQYAIQAHKKGQWLQLHSQGHALLYLPTRS